MLNVGLIDSLKVRVKMTDVAVIDKRIVQEYMRFYPFIASETDYDERMCFDETLEKSKGFHTVINGITYRFYPKSFITRDKVAEEYMVFQISAKMAKKKYFDGITHESLSQIVDDINNLRVVHVPYEKFLNGLVSDIDICINQLIEDKSLQFAFQLLNNSFRPTVKPLIRTINQTNAKGQRNLGMDFNNRDKATNTRPYLKIYHKGYELLSKSIDFYKAYLEPMPASILDKLVRFEFTIKAHKHKEYLIENGYNAEFKTLRDLLNASHKDLRLIAQSGLQHYVEPRARTKINPEQSPTDIAFTYLIEKLIVAGADRDTILAAAYQISDASSASRIRSKLRKIHDDLTSENSHLSIKAHQNEQANHFLGNLGFEAPF